MKRSLFLGAALASALFAIACNNQPAASSSENAATAAPENVEQTITDLEHKWVNAIVQKDTDTIDKILDPDFTGTTDDQIYTKTDAIEDVRDGTHESLDLSDLKVRVFGDTAVATMKQMEKSKHGNTDFSGEYLFTDVWAKRNGQWMAVASHGSRAR